MGLITYRLYNLNALNLKGGQIGDHYYTTNAKERDNLLSLGWKEDDIAFYSAIDVSSNRVPIYGVYNPNAYPSRTSGAHHLTLHKNEVDSLLSIGWLEGDPKFYGYAVPAKKYDILADREYSSADEYTGTVSDDMRMLTIDTNWSHFDSTTREEIEDYPK